MVTRRRIVNNLLDIKGLSAYYTKDKIVLNSCDFTIGQNEVVALVGSNGSGDSDIMMTDTINPLKSKFKGFHKTFKQDDLGLSLSSFLLN